MDRGAWWATVHRVTQSWVPLKWLTCMHARWYLDRRMAVPFALHASAYPGLIVSWFCQKRLFFFLIFIGVLMPYNVVLVSTVQQSESALQEIFLLLLSFFRVKRKRACLFSFNNPLTVVPQLSYSQFWILLLCFDRSSGQMTCLEH